ncbi:MAG TPA: cysteine desulfurase family protein [Candidatus Nitrosotalea sp.]|nr:cysteine desulfurase family protein [Candidatus Nitrosotalea sp.]
MNFARIYLDNSATTPLRAEVAAAMRDALENANYNPSSLHAEGRRARAALEDARERAAAVLGAARNEIVFTSGGTESDNLALLGALAAAPPGAHMVTTAIEHHAVLAAAMQLQARGVETTVLPAGTDATIAADDLAQALRPSTILASVMFVNNEVGTVQPIAELAAVAASRNVLFHTDAIQAPGWLPINVADLGADMLSLSAHKFGGPKGIGLLYLRRGAPLAPLLHGGSQEFARRAGTQNVAGAVGLAAALELAARERAELSARVEALRDRLEGEIVARIPDVRINGRAAVRIPSISNISFAGTESAAMLIALDLAGIAASAGSACTSGILEPSHVLAAMGVQERWQRGAIRFSMARTTTAAEIDRFLDALPPIVAALRRPVEKDLVGDG